MSSESYFHRERLVTGKLPYELCSEAIRCANWVKIEREKGPFIRGVAPYELGTGDTPALCDVPGWGTLYGRP